MVVEVDDPVLGRIAQVAPPAKFARTPPRCRAPPRSSGAPRRRRSPGRRSTSPRPPPRARPRAPLDGLRILDFGAYYAGPYSSRLLADLGADVIKLEPTNGDQLRGLARPFRSAQAGKRSIAANLKDPDLDDARARCSRGPTSCTTTCGRAPPNAWGSGTTTRARSTPRSSTCTRRAGARRVPTCSARASRPSCPGSSAWGSRSGASTTRPCSRSATKIPATGCSARRPCSWPCCTANGPGAGNTSRTRS